VRAESEEEAVCDARRLVPLSQWAMARSESVTALAAAERSAERLGLVRVQGA
jgi:hypothetical protein